MMKFFYLSVENPAEAVHVCARNHVLRRVLCSVIIVPSVEKMKKLDARVIDNVSHEYLFLLKLLRKF